jgi:hypothetical protein
MSLKITASKDNKIDFDLVGDTRTVHIAEDWNLCRMIPLSDITEDNNNDMAMKVQGKFLSIIFQDSPARERFEESIKRLQIRRREIEIGFTRLSTAVFTNSTQNDDGMLQPPSRTSSDIGHIPNSAPRLPRISPISSLELNAIVELDDNNPILHELNGLTND